MSGKLNKRQSVLVDDLGGGFPTFPMFVAMLRAYEVETDRRASIAAVEEADRERRLAISVEEWHDDGVTTATSVVVVGDVTRSLTSSWGPMGTQPAGSVNTMIGYHAGALMTSGSYNTVIGTMAARTEERAS